MLALWARYQLPPVGAGVPVAPRRCCDEREPEPDGGRGGFPGQATRQRDGLASVLQQALVDLPPPRAARRRSVEWIQQASPRLPAHERERRPPERQMARGTAGRPV